MVASALVRVRRGPVRRPHCCPVEIAACCPEVKG
jgi:hypothetical protein